jgi:glycosyltransferase involved in cell wall biosynthesis
VLYVGNIKPHKNLERLIEAFALARAGGPDDLRLVVIGDEISKYPGLRQSVHRHRLDKHVRFFGFQPAATLVAFYRLARAFVFPSLYEGFGLPPLEAMANLTPVVTSNLSSMPEVVGDAAVLVDPYDSQSIADGIRRVVTDEGLRQQLIARGRLRVQQFSWRTAAARTLDVYRDVMERR